jgi:chromosome segregation ATPase
MKQQLTDCVSTLEQLDHAHSIKIDQFKSKLELVEEKYRKKLTADTEKHRREVRSTRRKIGDVERRVDGVEKEVKKLQQEHLGQMLEVSQSRDEIKMELKAVSAKVAPSRKEISMALQLQEKLDQLKDDLQEKERILQEERNNNQGLKRETSRLRDEARIAQRRAALNL